MAHQELTHALRFCSASVLASQCANQHSKPQRRYSCLTKSPTWEIWSDIKRWGFAAGCDRGSFVALLYLSSRSDRNG